MEVSQLKCPAGLLLVLAEFPLPVPLTTACPLRGLPGLQLLFKPVHSVRCGAGNGEHWDFQSRVGTALRSHCGRKELDPGRARLLQPYYSSHTSRWCLALNFNARSRGAAAPGWVLPSKRCRTASPTMPFLGREEEQGVHAEPRSPKRCWKSTFALGKGATARTRGIFPPPQQQTCLQFIQTPGTDFI